MLVFVSRILQVTFAFALFGVGNAASTFGQATPNNASITGRAEARTKAHSFILIFLVLVLSCGLIAGCSTPTNRYKLRGTVVSKSVSMSQITINHEEIPGFMAAMTMPYPVRNPNLLEEVQPGDRITADVIVEGDATNYWLENIVITDKSGRGSSPGGLAAHELAVGEAVPDVPMINQDGKTIELSQFKGKFVLLTFIYTRCPFPDFCPLLSNEFATIHNEIAKSPPDLARTHLLSISLDPAYDTAPVLRKYGLSYLKGDPSGFSHWDFASTSPADLRKLAAAFGMEYFEKDNQISHTQNTVLIAPDGTVAMTWPGNDWRPPEILEVLRHSLMFGH